MGRGILYELTDNQYLRLDGKNAMSGFLRLAGQPQLAVHAASKGYVDALFSVLDGMSTAEINALLLAITAPTTGLIDTRIATIATTFLALAGGTMTGVLTLAGAPVNPLEAATAGYVDAGDALLLPLGGGVMTGLVELSGDPGNPLEAATKQYVDGVVPPATLDTYDAVVAPAGGDYTLPSAACAAEGVGAKIFIKPGTYMETVDIELKDGQRLIGQNKDDCLINFGATASKIFWTGAGIHREVSQLTIAYGTTDYQIELDGEYARVDNCYVVGNNQSFSGVRLVDGGGVVSRCTFLGHNRGGEYCVQLNGDSLLESCHFDVDRGGVKLLGSHNRMIGNILLPIMSEFQIYMETENTVTGNVFKGNNKIRFYGPGNVFSGNVMMDGADPLEWGGDFDNQTIVGNYFKDSGVSCNQAGVTGTTITGNTFENSQGILLTEGIGFTISGNIFIGTGNIVLGAAAKYNNIVGNNFHQSTEPEATKIDDAGVANSAMQNMGVSDMLEKHFSYMKNTSGGNLVAGNAVIFKAVAAGNEFDTTVVPGDEFAWGCLAEDIDNNALGYVQRRGKTTKLKVNGTAAINIGDLISTFTVAGIGRAVLANHMGFAIALEAYAGADDNGVIDALLIALQHY